MHVLLIDSDQQRCNDFKLLMDFIDHGLLTLNNSSQLTPATDDDVVPEVIILGDSDDAVKTLTDLQAIKKRFGENMPVLLWRENDLPLAAEINSHIVTSLEQPLKYRQLIHALHLAEVYVVSKQGGSVGSHMLFRSLVGNSRAIQHVRKLIEQVADTEANVLILGDSGTGKEVVARNLHYYSSRREKPFVPVNCGAIPPDLLESELFGHEKGAFTGAISSRQGRFELAEGGTLFLDEIGDMPLAMQVKILRVIQERIFERVGSNKSIKTNVRIIAATHRNLEEEIQAERFREDLYYRLNVFPIDMPPLRDRIEDLPLLINELVTRMEHEQRGSVRLTPGAVTALCQYPWPGNVRELSNLVERLVIMFPYGVVDVRDLPEKFRGNAVLASLPEEQTATGMDALPAAEPSDALQRLPTGGLDLKEHLTNLEYSLIKQALDESEGVVAHAAKRLHMRRTTLVEKMRKYGLHRQEQAS